MLEQSVIVTSQSLWRHSDDKFYIIIVFENDIDSKMSLILFPLQVSHKVPCSDCG